MKRWLVGLAAVALLFGGVGQAFASFILKFDENGNASINNNGTGFVPLTGTLAPDPSAPGNMGLTYMLPSLVNNGDVSVFDANPTTAPVLSDLMRFTNANGDIAIRTVNGAVNTTADRMIFYSVKDDGSTTSDGLADLPFTTLPGNANGSVNEIQSEPTTGLVNFDWLPNGTGGNEYIGISDTPEPATLTLFGIGIAGIVGYGWRRRKTAAA